MNVGDPSSLLTQPLEDITNTMEPDPLANKRKSKLKKANRHSTKSVLETMPACDTSNNDTVESLGGAKKTPPKLTTTPSSAKHAAWESTIDLTESSPPPAPKITPGSTRVESENTMPASSPTHMTTSSPTFEKNEVIVVSNKDTKRADDASPKPEPELVSKKKFSAAKPEMRTSANVNPTISASSKEATQKKKKQSFHDKILYTMLTSCKPYTLKSLAQATDTTVEALRHAMLSFLDKHLVLSKEFPSKSSGREPKTLYWANPIRLSEVETGGDHGGKKSSGGAVIKELSKLLATQQDIQAANITRQQLQEQYRAVQAELNPLLAIPTTKQLDHELLDSEEKLQHVRNEIAAVKDRIAQPPSSLANSVHKEPLQSKSQNPTMLKRKINYMLGEYKTRKRKCMDFVEELSDAMEKKTKDVMGEKILCLDTDEMEWGVWEDGGSGKVSGTTSTKTKQVKNGLLAGRTNDLKGQPLMTKIPAKYNDV